MSLEEVIRELNEKLKKREKTHTKFKGFVEGLKAGGQLTQTEKDMLWIIEYVIDGFKNSWDDIVSTLKLQLQTTKRVSSLETKMSEIESNVLQLRQTLDRMVQDK